MKGENFFDRLLLLPLFQGIGRNDFWEIAEQTRISFHSCEADTRLVEQDAPCESLLFIMNGKLCAARTNDSHTYTLREYMERPDVLQPESLFGPITHYTRTYTAITPVQYFEIKKRDVHDRLLLYPTFRINYLNLLTRQAQHSLRHLWQTTPEALSQRFIHFVHARSLRPAGPKELTIKMQDLATELLTTRLNVSYMLRELEAEQLIWTHRGRIEIPQFEKLVQRL